MPVSLVRFNAPGRADLRERHRRAGFRKLVSRPMSLARRPIALLAAYVFALQILLLPLGLAGSGLGGAHCAPDNPAQHQTDTCPCAGGCGTLCCQPLVSEPAAGFVARLAHVLPQPLPVHAAEVRRPLLRGPQTARPPPVAERA